MFEIYDLATKVALLGGFTTAAAARKAAWVLFRDRLWGVRPTEG